jgi:hypothetical protein
MATGADPSHFNVVWNEFAYSAVAAMVNVQTKSNASQYLLAQQAKAKPGVAGRDRHRSG